MPEALTSPALAWSIGIGLASLGVAWAVLTLMKGAVRRLASRTGTALDNLLLDALEIPLVVAIVLAGSFISLAIFYSPEPLPRVAGVVLAAAGVLLGAYAAIQVVGALARWYLEELAHRIRTGLDDKLVPVFRWLLQIAAAALGLLVALDVAGMETGPHYAWLRTHGLRMGGVVVVATILGLLLGEFVPLIIRRTVARGMEGQPQEEIDKRAQTLSSALAAAGQVVVLLVAGFMVLSELGLNIGPILAGAGVAGIAIGFGAQSLVKDIIAGVFVLLENQYRVGDVVKIADVQGLVEDINLRRTVLRDMDGAVHVVPNGEVRVASNFSKEWARVNINITIGYGEDLDRVMAVIDQVGQELAQDPQWQDLILTPPRSVRVENFRDSGIDIKVMGDTTPLKQWDVTGELRKRLKRAFDQEGIEIPWPHMKVYFGQPPARRRGMEGED